MDFNVELVKLITKWKSRTQGEMIRALNNKRIKNVSGKLRQSVMNMKILITGSNISIQYKGPFYAKWIDARVPGYKGFKGFKKLPTHFLDPLGKFKELLIELQKQTTDLIVKDLNIEIKNIKK